MLSEDWSAGCFDETPEVVDEGFYMLNSCIFPRCPAAVLRSRMCDTRRCDCSVFMALLKGHITSRYHRAGCTRHRDPSSVYFAARRDVCAKHYCPSSNFGSNLIMLALPSLPMAQVFVEDRQTCVTPLGITCTICGRTRFGHHRPIDI